MQRTTPRPARLTPWSDSEPFKWVFVRKKRKRSLLSGATRSVDVSDAIPIRSGFPDTNSCAVLVHHRCGMAAHRFRHWMAHPSRGMDIEEREGPLDRSLLLHHGRPTLVYLGVARRRS